MVTMAFPLRSPDRCPQGVRTLSKPILLDSPNLCPVCQKVPLRGKQRVCAGKCRIARSRQRHESERQQRDQRARLLIRTAMEALQEARALLDPDSTSVDTL